MNKINRKKIVAIIPARSGSKGKELSEETKRKISKATRKRMANMTVEQKRIMLELMKVIKKILNI